MESKKYKWTYCSLGDAVRVNITSGEDIAHLGELDQKLWTVLSCPVKGLDFDEQTLTLLDTDNDGRIRVPEIVEAAQWLTRIIKDRDSILLGSDVLKLDAINDEDTDGARLLASARQILANLGIEKDEISFAEAADSKAIFAGTPFNGDGVISSLSASDEALKALIAQIASCEGTQPDRSGEAGIDQAAIETFYTSLADYYAWRNSATDAILPFGADTAEAKTALDAIKDKVEDYFTRCRLIAFDSNATEAVDVPAAKIAELAGSCLAPEMPEISLLPLARPDAGASLVFARINPAWETAFARFRSLIMPEAESMSRDEWESVKARFVAYDAWMAAKKGAEVEALGCEEIARILKEDRRAELLALVEQDKALSEQSASIDEVGKLLRLYRDFARLLRNYVLFSDFYSVKCNTPAIFEAGRLYIDQRCCKLCIKVEDMGKHADMAAQSGMFLIYCNCTSKTKAAAMDIVAVMTAGKVHTLKPGKNGVFYDRDGEDWDAVITKIVDNPVSVRQAFWSPYRKLAAFITDKINKNAAEKEANATSTLLAAADKPAAPGQAPQPFDIGKFAGIFAAIGMAVGAIGVAISSIFKGIFALSWWQLLLVIVAIMLLISGPSCFIAWSKLRRRNLGPLLNANGWAINSVVLVNTIFGATLTSVAKYPRMRLSDPYSTRTPIWKKWLYGILVAALLGAAAYVIITERRKVAPEEEVIVAVEEVADSVQVVAEPAENVE